MDNLQKNKSNQSSVKNRAGKYNNIVTDPNDPTSKRLLEGVRLARLEEQGYIKNAIKNKKSQ